MIRSFPNNLLACFLMIWMGFFTLSSYAKDNTVSTKGFLTADELPKLQNLVVPPKETDPAFQLDIAHYKKWAANQDDPRVKMAAEDAPGNIQDIVKRFSEAFGSELSEEQLPDIFTLLKRASYDIYSTGSLIKKTYLRIRPFVHYQAKTCNPDEEKNVKPNYSFPSGHSITGWAIALLLTEINPERQHELFKRGYEYGVSRVVCGYHWQSDVDSGRLIASALVARLHANAEFLEAMKKAKKEWQLKK